jgi:transcriptional regulator NrdR family protein
MEPFDQYKLGVSFVKAGISSENAAEVAKSIASLSKREISTEEIRNHVSVELKLLDQIAAEKYETSQRSGRS